MIRPVRPDGRIETGGAFVPIFRSRVVDRIASAARQRVVLIIAPAGYGKSVSLSQYLQGIVDPWVRYDLLGDNTGLLGFLRGFADAIIDIAPDARTTLAGAYEKNAESESPGAHLALWMHTHLSSYRGVIAIDDLHVAQEDREVMRFLASLVERTKGRISWIFASRSTVGLPIGTWLAYGESDLAIDDHDLKFSLQEARDAARSFKLAVGDQELSELLNLTDGWATALSFALRSSTRSVDLRAVSTMTREMVYHYLAEQVYGEFDQSELEFIETAALLPEIEVDVMIAAGFDRAIAMIEELRGRVAFIYESRPAVYRLHDLFKDYVLHELARRGVDAERERIGQVAGMLEGLGRHGAALRLYAKSANQHKIAALVKSHGLALIDHGYSDDVRAALSAINADEQDDDVRGIVGLLQLGEGKFESGERYLARAVARAKEPLLRAELLLRYAIHLLNKGGDAPEALQTLAADESLDERYRLEAHAALAFSYARSGREAEARGIIERVADGLPRISDEGVLAKLLLRVGTSLVFLGDFVEARDMLTQAASVAAAQGLWALVSRSHRSLALAARNSGGETASLLWHAQQASVAATRAGDYYDLQGSLILTLSVETQRGNADGAAAIEKQLGDLGRTDASVSHYLLGSQAHRHAWEGRFAEAHRMFGTIRGRPAHAADRAFVAAVYCLCLALDGAEEACSAATGEALQAISLAPADEVLVSIAAIFVAVSDLLSRRLTVARRAILRRKRAKHEVVSIVTFAAEELLAMAESQTYESAELSAHLAAISAHGFGGYARYFELAASEIERQRLPDDLVHLTPSEMRVLRALAEGRSPKQIAADMGRSVLTVQTHVQNVARKLGGHGRADTIAAARRLGLL